MKLRKGTKLLGVLLLGGSALLVSCKTPSYNTPADLYRVGSEALSRAKFADASEYFKQLLESPFRIEALINLADAFYEDERYEEARVQYQKFLQLYPVHPFAAKAQFQIGMTAYQRIKTADRDQTFSQEAIKEFEKVVKNFPLSPYATDAQRNILAARKLLAEHAMGIANFYYTRGAWGAAIPRYTKVLMEYPEVSFLDEALFKLGQSYFAEESFLEAAKLFAQLIQHFPQSTYAAEAKQQLQQLQ
jgi:outer membrane protein assembly factor BamD